MRIQESARRRLGIFMCLFCSVGSLTAQSNSETLQQKNVQVLSPNVASIGKYLDIPVSNHTGVPKINVPIYTIEAGPLKVPISIEYHASGLKVMEQASWVGAGWSLMAGGLVTRTIRGNADEKLHPPPSLTPNATSYFNNNGYYDYQFNTQGDLDYLNFTNGYKDGEPDLFFFNFNGYTGKFYFRADGTPVLLPKQDIKIQRRLCDGNSPVPCNQASERLYGWIITTPDGAVYTFGKTEDTEVYPFERTNTMSVEGVDSFADLISTWYLTSIKSPDGEFEIKFFYEKEEYSFYGLSMYPTLDGGGMDLIKNYIHGVQIDSIAFPNGWVTFVTDSNPRQDLSDDVGAPGGFTDQDNVKAKPLKEIRIASPTFCKKFELGHSYFVSDKPLVGTYDISAGVEASLNLHTDKKRLKLVSLTEKGCYQPEVRPPYFFSYYDETSVPRTLSLAQDHWGYYNGADDNEDLVPPLSTDGGYLFEEGGTANRESSWPAVRAGALKKIQYPTGGSTEFKYGPNEVFIYRPKYVQTPPSYDISAQGSGSGQVVTVQVPVSSTAVYKLSVRTIGGGNGTVSFGNKSISPSSANYVDYLAKADAGTQPFRAQAGNGLFNGQGVQATLVRLDQFYQWEKVTVGGLRIDTLIHDPGPGSVPVITRYKYTDSLGYLQGILYARPNYITLAKNDYALQTKIWIGMDGNFHITGTLSDGCAKSNFEGTENAFLVSPGSIHPMRKSQGYHIGYNEVRVIQGDGGFTKYNYALGTNPAEDVSKKVIDISICDPSAPNIPPAPEPYDFHRGELQRVRVYTADSIKLKDTRYSSVFQPEQTGVSGMIVRFIETNFATFITHYEQKTAKKVKTTEDELIYSRENPGRPPLHKVTETFYESSSHEMPTRITFSESTGGTILREIRNAYVPDLALPACTTNDCTIYYYPQYDASGCASNDAACRLQAWKTYAAALNNTWKTDVRDCGIQTRPIINNCFATAKTNANEQTKNLFRLRDMNQVSQLIEVSRWRNGKFLESAFTSFKNYGSGDEIHVYPDSLLFLSASPTGSTVFAPAIKNTSLVHDGKYRYEELYRFESGTLVERINKAGLPTSFIWSYQKTRPVVKAVGVPYLTLKSAYQNLVQPDPDLNGLRSLPGMISTYSYDPLFGMTRETDPNKVSINYEYDKLGRLKLIRDQKNNILKKYVYEYYKP